MSYQIQSNGMGQDAGQWPHKDAHESYSSHLNPHTGCVPAFSAQGVYLPELESCLESPGFSAYSRESAIPTWVVISFDGISVFCSSHEIYIYFLLSLKPSESCIFPRLLPDKTT